MAAPIPPWQYLWAMKMLTSILNFNNNILYKWNTEEDLHFIRSNYLGDSMES